MVLGSMWYWEAPVDVDPEDHHYNRKLICAGVASTFATALLHPLDLLKIRIQISSTPETVKFMLRRVVLAEGYRGLYKGLSAALFRQASSAVTRIGVYNVLNDYNKKQHNRPFLHTSIPDRVYMGVYVGMAGAAVGSPAELVLVRMMATCRCPSTNHPCVRENTKPYKSCTDGIKRIVREEGFFTLWRGMTLTLMRSVVISSGQIGAYLHIRDMMIKHKLFPAENKFEVHTASCTISSFISAVLSLPIDGVKSWYQIRRRGTTLREVVTCLVKSKGKQYLWSGFWPYYMRMVCYTVFTYFFITEFDDAIESYKDLENAAKDWWWPKRK